VYVIRYDQTVVDGAPGQLHDVVRLHFSKEGYNYSLPPFGPCVTQALPSLNEPDTQKLRGVLWWAAHLQVCVGFAKVQGVSSLYEKTLPSDNFHVNAATEHIFAANCEPAKGGSAAGGVNGRCTHCQKFMRALKERHGPTTVLMSSKARLNYQTRVDMENSVRQLRGQVQEQISTRSRTERDHHHEVEDLLQQGKYLATSEEADDLLAAAKLFTDHPDHELHKKLDQVLNKDTTGRLRILYKTNYDLLVRRDTKLKHGARVQLDQDFLRINLAVSVRSPAAAKELAAVNLVAHYSAKTLQSYSKALVPENGICEQSINSVMTQAEEILVARGLVVHERAKKVVDANADATVKQAQFDAAEMELVNLRVDELCFKFKNFMNTSSSSQDCVKQLEFSRLLDLSQRERERASIDLLQARARVDRVTEAVKREIASQEHLLQGEIDGVVLLDEVVVAGKMQFSTSGGVVRGQLARDEMEDLSDIYEKLAKDTPAPLIR
jgi:hypothetical protein